MADDTKPRRPKPGGSLARKIRRYPVKVLIAGPNGTGKTATLLGLAQAGYNVRVADFDNGLDILVELAMREKNGEEILKNIRYRTLVDRMQKQGDAIIPRGVPKAFQTCLDLFDNWVDREGSLGPIYKWGLDDVLTIDSLTFASKAAMRYHLVKVGRTAKAWNSDYFDAQNYVEAMLAILTGPAVKCNVVVLTHITDVKTKNVEGDDITQFFPSTIGKALSPQIASYFNTLLEAKVKGTGASAKRILLTRPQGILAGTKCPAELPAELPQSTGLAQFFKAVQSSPAAQAAAQRKEPENGENNDNDAGNTRT